MADDLSLLFSIRAKNETAAEMKTLERQIASLRDRIKEIKAEGKDEIGFKAERIKGHQERIKELTAKYKELKDKQAETAKSSEDVASALSAISPRLGGMASSLTSAAGPLTAAAVGLAAVTAGAAAAVVAFGQMVKSTADFEGKFLDLSQQVGVAVETLSTLDIIASTTGGSIDTVTASLGIFQKNLEDAHDPTSKQSKLLKDLGVTSLDTEVALRQTLKGLFALGEGAKQTDASLELFGRGGRFVNAILKESEGDLDAATAKFQEMGLVVGGPAAGAADQFNDLLEIISRQLNGLTRQIAGNTIPVFVAFFEDISKALARSKNDWLSWNSVIQTTTAAALASVQTLVQMMQTRGATLDFGISLFFQNRDSLLERARKLESDLFIEAETEKLNRLASASGRPGDRPDADKALAEAQARANREIALLQKSLEETTREHRLKLERERELDSASIDEWERQAKAQADDRNANQQKIYDQEIANARRFAKSQEDLALALLEIQQKRNKSLQDLLNEHEQIEREAQKRRDKIELDTNKQIASIRDAAREGELTRIKDALDRKQIIESEALTLELALLKDAHEQRLLLIDIELEQQTSSAARKQELDNQKLESEQRYTDAVRRLTEQRLDALAREQLEQNQRGQAQGIPLSEDTMARAAGVAASIEAGLPPPAEFDARKTAITAGLEAMREGFAGLADAVGSAIDGFIKFGTAGTSFRKFVTEILSGIARMAAVKAIFHLAEGFAALAMAFFGIPNAGPSAAAHFKAAAIYGAIAGIAAVAGRATAGGAFTQDAGGGGGTGGSGGSGGRTTSGRPDRPQTVEVDRTRFQPIARELVFRVKGDAVVDSFIEDFDLNGRTRIKILSEG